MNGMWMIVSSGFGAALGVFHFGGLWLTVQRLSTSRNAPLLMFASFVIRAVVVLSGFFLVMGGRWERLVACLAGFLLARAMLIRRLRIAPIGIARRTQPCGTE